MIYINWTKRAKDPQIIGNSILDCTVVNSYIIYKENIKNHRLKYDSHLRFRAALVNDLIDNFTSKKRPGYFPMKGHARKRNSSFGQITVKNSVRLASVGNYFPVKIASYRSCANCSTKTKEKTSNVICKTCNVALFKDCFATFHTTNQ